MINVIQDRRYSGWFVYWDKTHNKIYCLSPNNTHKQLYATKYNIIGRIDYTTHNQIALTRYPYMYDLQNVIFVHM